MSPLKTTSLLQRVGYQIQVVSKQSFYGVERILVEESVLGRARCIRSNEQVRCYAKTCSVSLDAQMPLTIGIPRGLLV